MKRIFSLLVLGMLCLPGLGRAEGSPLAETIRTCQLEADHEGWRWDERESTPAFCAARRRGGYQVELVYPAERFWDVLIRIKDTAGALKLEIRGHDHTVFDIVGDTCYYALYTPIDDGCAVAAYDLQAGVERWRTHLRGIGAIEHSVYSNRVTLAADDHLVRVKGWEAEKYLEVLDARTGRTIAHRIFAEPREGMTLGVSLDRPRYVPGETARLTASITNAGSPCRVLYTPEFLGASTLHLIDPNGSEFVRRHTHAPIKRYVTLPLATGETAPVLSIPFPLTAQPAGIWSHRFDDALYSPMTMPDGRTIPYSNPSVATLPPVALPAPGTYHLYLTYDAGVEPPLRSNTIAFTIADDAARVSADLPSFHLDATYRGHAFQFLLPSPSGRYLACLMPRDPGGEGLWLLDTARGDWTKAPVTSLNELDWLPDESGLVLSVLQDAEAKVPVTHVKHDIKRVGLDGRVRTLATVDGVLSWTLLPDGNGLALVCAHDWRATGGKDSPDTGTWRTQARVLDFHTGAVRTVWTAPATAARRDDRGAWLSLRRDGDDWALAYRATGDSPLDYWVNLRTGQARTVDANAAQPAEFSPDGQYVAVGGQLWRARTWPSEKGVITQGRPLAACPLPEDHEATYLWASDSHHLALRKWDPERTLDTFRTPVYPVTGAAPTLLAPGVIPAKSWVVSWAGPTRLLLETRAPAGESLFFLASLGTPKPAMTEKDALLRIVWDEK